jgi:hypothetical protein
MATSQNVRKGTQSGRSARNETQSDWDSFSLIAGTPKDPKGFSLLIMEARISHRSEPGVEDATHQEGNMLEGLSPQQQMPGRRGNPRKNKEVGETQVPNKPRARSTGKELIMHTIQLEPVKGTSQGTESKTRRTDAAGTNV